MVPCDKASRCVKYGVIYCYMQVNFNLVRFDFTPHIVFVIMTGTVRAGAYVGQRFGDLPRVINGNYITSRYAPVAQLDRVSDSDSEGRWFESSRAYHE